MLDLSQLQPQQIDLILNMGRYGVQINLVLMAVNLIPVLPLDGGRILSQLLPRRLVYYFDQTEPYGLLVVVAGLYLGIFSPFLNMLFGLSFKLIDMIV